MRTDRDGPGTWRDPQWWLMVTTACAATGTVAAGLAPGTGMTPDARLSVVFWGAFFGMAGVHELWWWWRRRPRSVIRSIVRTWRAFFDPKYGLRHEDHADGRMWHATAPALSAHVAWLCERDGMTAVRVAASSEDPRRADVFATTPDGAPLLIRINGRKSGKFTGVARARMRALADETTARGNVDGARYAYAVAESRGLGAFTFPARRVAKRHGITLVDADDITLWELGNPPPGLGLHGAS